MYPIRGAVTFKATAGTNVASDALSNLASGGVTGGALLIIGEDYGEGSSIMQERSHAFAMKSQIWLMDPRPNLESLVKAVEDGFALSEASNTPVMLEVRIRTCHVHGSFMAKDNKRPPLTLKQALENPVRDTNRIVLPPASYGRAGEDRAALAGGGRLHQAAQAQRDVRRRPRRHRHHSQGGMYNTVIRALGQLGLADVWGATRVPLYVMNVTYPLVDDEIVAFCATKQAVLIVEEGQPEYIEQAINTILRRRDVNTKVYGKGMLPMAGLTPDVMFKGVKGFVVATAPAALPDQVRAANAPSIHEDDRVKELAKTVPPRPPGFYPAARSGRSSPP